MSETMALKGAEKNLSVSFPVSVIMQKSRSDNTWVDEIWEAIGVTVGERDGSGMGSGKIPELIFQQGGITRYLHTGFHLELFVDECESYYFNLISASPRCFIVADQNENDIPVPFIVSLSFDVAHSYLEGDETVYAVALPPELYRWSEAFILEHYAPEKKIKRKRNNWKQDSGDRKHLL